MITILIGAPGAGKGTQSSLLCERFSFIHLSTGDIFRAEMTAQSAVGKKAAEYVNNGKLDETQKGRYLLDGFPRNLAQAQALSGLLAQRKAGVDLVLFLNLTPPEAMKRLTSRRICGACGEVFNVLSRPPKAEGTCDKCGKPLVQREDDTEATASKRLMVYEDLTRPLVAYYKAEGVLHEIDGGRSPEAVAASLAEILAPQLGAR